VALLVDEVREIILLSEFNLLAISMMRQPVGYAQPTQTVPDN
jgi:hypothetical protein